VLLVVVVLINSGCGYRPAGG